MNKIILIDGDILAYEIGFSVEQPMYVCDNKLYQTRGHASAWAKKTDKEIFKRINIGSFKQVETNFKSKLKIILDDLGTKTYKIYLTAGDLSNNYRSKISTLMPYKGNREASTRPFWYKKLRQLMVEVYRAEVVRGQEADDAIGIEQYRVARIYDSFDYTYIASIDKDLKMLEGWHYNLTTRTVEHVSAEQGLKNFVNQILKGDATDNIPGLTRLMKIMGNKEGSDKLSHSRPGYLKTFTEYMLDHSPNECLEYVIDLYYKNGGTTEHINEIAQLLWIRREENELWQLKEL